MTRQVRNAVAQFKSGFSCSQAVLAAFSDSLGLEEATALKISQPFGGGMAQMGLTCGAVTGAYMVMGLKYGRFKVDDDEARDKTYTCVKEFNQRFIARHGSLICSELLGCDFSTPEGRDKAVSQGLHDELCPRLVQSAAEILEEILK